MEISPASFPFFALSFRAFSTLWKMVSLAGYNREIAEQGIYDQTDIVEHFVKWHLEIKYMILCHEKEEYRKLLGEIEFIAVKCAKRGNDVYKRCVESRLFGIKSRTENLSFDYWKKPHSNMLFITLTYDTKRCSFAQAWSNLGTEFNRFNANLRKKYGKFLIFRTWESYANGFPHIHAIYLFQEHKFKVFPSYETKKNGKVKLVWRIEDKDGIAEHWHSWVDIQAVSDLHGGIRYLEKYIMKCAEFDQKDVKGLLTLAMCWVFRKKAFYVSGQFRKALSDLIATICSSKTRKIQVNLFGKELKSNKWRVLGFIDISLLEAIEVNYVKQWTIKLTSSCMDKIYAKWDQC